LCEKEVVLFIHGVLRTEINLRPDHFSTFNFIPSTLLSISKNSSTNLPLCSLYALAAKEVLYLTGGSILHIFLQTEKRSVEYAIYTAFSFVKHTTIQSNSALRFLKGLGIEQLTI
jgi:hypothetical protein